MTKNLYLIGIVCLLGILCSCGNSKDKRWIKTEEGIEYFLPEEPSLLSLGKYYWSGDSIAGLAYGKGTLKYVGSWSDKDNYSITGFAHFGAIVPDNEEKLYFIGSKKDYLLDGFGAWSNKGRTIIANFKKGEAFGDGKIYQDLDLVYSGELKNSLPNGQGYLYENNILKYEGNFKKGKYDGEGILYYPDGKTAYEGDFEEGEYDGNGTLYLRTGTILYKGKFKKGKFHGKGEINVPVYLLDSLSLEPANQLWKFKSIKTGNYHIDSVTNKIVLYRDSNVCINECHVFDNGAIKPLHKEYYDRINEKILELEPEVYEKIYDRINRWETNAWWQYLIAIGCLGILWLLLFAIYYDGNETDYDGNLKEKASLYGRIEKWNPLKIYPVWLLFGWFGFHRAELKSSMAFIYGTLSSILVLINLRNITLFVFWPTSWSFMSVSAFSIYVVVAIILLLIADFAWIPWRCYWLNHTYYRHDLREDKLIASTPTDVDHLVRDIHPKVKTAIYSLNGLVKRTKEIQNNAYTGKTSSFNLKRIVGVTLGNDEWAEFELNRLQSLESALKDYTRTQDNFAELAQHLNSYLAEARNTAYRNINLAKELIGWMRKIKAQETILEQDRELHSQFSSFDFSTIQMPEIDLGVDFDSTCKQCVKTTNLLMSTGLKLGPSLAIGAAISLASHIADALQKAQKLCEEANEKSRLAVKGIGESLDNIVKSEADILRACEILASLNEANKAFIKAYAVLRDAYTGDSPSFSYFIRGGVIIPERNYREDLILLQQVTSEYNKINKAKL